MDTNLFEHRIYSDIDFPLCCLFQVLTDERSTEELIKKLYRQDYCQEVFKAALEARKIDNKLAEEGRFSEASDLVTAAQNTFIAACMSRAAGMNSYDKDSARRRMDGYYNRILNLGQFIPILSGVEVIRWDCRRLIDEINDRNDYLVYCDPPYDPKAMRGNKHYEYSWNREDHINFRDLIKNTETYMVISGYASEIYDELPKPKWKKIFLKNKHVSMSGNGRRAPEYVYINFPITDDLKAVISSN